MRVTLLLASWSWLTYVVAAFHHLHFQKLAQRPVMISSILRVKHTRNSYQRASVNTHYESPNESENSALQMISHCKAWLQQVSASAAVVNENRVQPNVSSTFSPSDPFHLNEAFQSQKQTRDSIVLQGLATLTEQFASVLRQLSVATQERTTDVVSLSLAFAQKIQTIVQLHQGTLATGQDSAIPMSEAAVRPSEDSHICATDTTQEQFSPKYPATSTTAGTTTTSTTTTNTTTTTAPYNAASEGYRQVAMRPVKQAYEQSTSSEYRHLAEDYLTTLKSTTASSPATFSTAHLLASTSVAAKGNVAPGSAWMNETATTYADYISESRLSDADFNNKGGELAEGEVDGDEWTDSIEHPVHSSTYTTTAATAAWPNTKGFRARCDSPQDRQGKKLVREGNRYVYR